MNVSLTLWSTEDLFRSIGLAENSEPFYYELNRRGVALPDKYRRARGEIERKQKRNFNRRNLYRTNADCRLKRAVRRRFSKYLRSGQSRSMPAIVGCDLETLIAWLELWFKEGMTWDNYGSEWHVDHIQPLASFDFTVPDQVREAFHFSNLQPLWAHENMSKGSKLQ